MKKQKKSVIAAIENKNNFETQQILATQLDLPTKSEEHTRPQADRSVRLELTLSQEQFEKLKSVKSWVSHQIPTQGTAEVLEYVMDLFLAKKQGVSSKEKSVEKSEAKREAPSPEIKNQTSGPVAKKQVLLIEPKLEIASSGPKIDRVFSGSKIETAPSGPNIETVSLGSKTETVFSTPKIETASTESKSKTLTLESKRTTVKSESQIEAPAVKPSSSPLSTYSMPSNPTAASGSRPLSKTTLAAGGNLVSVETRNLSRTKTEKEGSIPNLTSTEIMELQAADMLPLFNWTTRSNKINNTERGDRVDKANRGDRTDRANIINNSEKTDLTFTTLETRRQCSKDFIPNIEHHSQNNPQKESRYNSEYNSKKHSLKKSQDNLQTNSQVHSKIQAKERAMGAPETIPIVTMPMVTSLEGPIPTVVSPAVIRLKETKSKETRHTMRKSVVKTPNMTLPNHPLPLGANIGKTSSRYIAVKTKQEVWRRAGGCCEHRNANGERCQSRYQLQFDHIEAHAIGGSNGRDNLQLFCRTHNLWKATQEGIGLDSTPIPFTFLLGN